MVATDSVVLAFTVSVTPDATDSVPDPEMVGLAPPADVMVLIVAELFMLSVLYWAIVYVPFR